MVKRDIIVIALIIFVTGISGIFVFLKEPVDVEDKIPEEYQATQPVSDDEYITEVNETINELNSLADEGTFDSVVSGSVSSEFAKVPNAAKNPLFKPKLSIAMRIPDNKKYKIAGVIGGNAWKMADSSPYGKFIRSTKVNSWYDGDGCLRAGHYYCGALASYYMEAYWNKYYAYTKRPYSGCVSFWRITQVNPKNENDKIVYDFCTMDAKSDNHTSLNHMATPSNINSLPGHTTKGWNPSPGDSFSLVEFHGHYDTMLVSIKHNSNLYKMVNYKVVGVQMLEEKDVIQTLEPDCWSWAKHSATFDKSKAGTGLYQPNKNVFVNVKNW